MPTGTRPAPRDGNRTAKQVSVCLSVCPRGLRRTVSATSKLCVSPRPCVRDSRPNLRVLFPSTVGEPRTAVSGERGRPRSEPALPLVTLGRRRGAEGCGREQTVPPARPFLMPHVTLVSNGSRSCSRSQGCAEPAHSAPRLRPHGPPPLSVSTQPLLALKRHRSALNPGWLCFKIFD